MIENVCKAGEHSSPLRRRVKSIVSRRGDLWSPENERVSIIKADDRWSPVSDAHRKANNQPIGEGLPSRKQTHIVHKKQLIGECRFLLSKNTKPH